jgi:hypothetical protein
MSEDEKFIELPGDLKIIRRGNYGKTYRKKIQRKCS